MKDSSSNCHELELIPAHSLYASIILLMGIHGAKPSNVNYEDSVARKTQRRYPAHGVSLQLNQPTIVFVTACTKDRLPWLATSAHHHLLRKLWTSATAWQVGRYVLMPDHLHLFAAPSSPMHSLDSWIKFWKSAFQKQTRPNAGRWQTGYWDRRLRRSEDYDAKWNYVMQNPVRHGLVSQTEDWQFKGEIFHLAW